MVRMTLAAKNVTISRGGAEVVRGLSCALEPGAITAICGPNGAGKSSLLMGLAGLLPAASGEILLGGQALPSLHPRERAKRIGYLPQDGQIAWDVATEALVRLGRHPHGDRGEAVVAKVMQTLDLTGFAGRPVTQLSGGERARALLGRVLAGEPDWILADEPLAALDIAHQLALLRHLRAEANRGTGVVLVLHDLALAMNHADRVLVMKDGRLLADAPPEEALSEAKIAAGWGVEMRWLGDMGARALAAR